MTHLAQGPAPLRPISVSDVTASLRHGIADFAAAPLIGLFFAAFYVGAGLLMLWVTQITGQTYWLVLAVMGFPLVGAFAALGLYETSRRKAAGEPLNLASIASVVWRSRTGQLPWLAVIIVVIFLFWFFLGHMIFALFLGLRSMVNVSTSFEIYMTTNGLSMLAVGSVVGAGFASLVFGLSVLGMPMLLDRDVDFVSAMLRSLAAVRAQPLLYLGWGAFVGLTTLVAMMPWFLGLFVALPILGHATWHLYKAATS